MPPLADVQTRFRAALVEGDEAAVAPLLVGGRDPRQRLAIHRRHYETSLATAVVGRFPALAWLVGEPFLRQAAHSFVRRHPPTGPCIAEYGEGFPGHLALRPGARRLPYLRAVGELEWHLGQVALAVEHPSLGMDALRDVEAGRLADVALEVQPGLRYIEAPWPVDELVQLYLSDSPPDRWVLRRTPVRLQIRGSRGSFRMERLDRGTFVFRSALADGLSLGDAAERALDVESAFDAGGALVRVMDAGLATGIKPAREGRRQ